MKKRRIIIIFSILSVLFIASILLNIGFLEYYFNKTFSSSAKLIEKYAEITLPDDVIIRSITFKKDIEGDSLTEVLEAEIVVGEAYSNELFDNDNMDKDFDYTHGFNKSYGISEDEFNYGIWNPSGVTSVRGSTQRSIYYYVLNPIDGKTTIYIFVDKLGWTK